ncbi:MAG: hypothetical protein KC456_00980 [Flavobacteriales bacterium]|nr:hypothetical protein [Flavobacteriales bacterium]
MVKNAFGILLLFLFSLQIFAGETLIQGNAFYHKGKDIELHKYLDLFTFQSEVVTSQEIIEDGNFRFQIDLNETGLYLLKIGKVHAHIFLSPDDQYTVVMPEPIEADRYNPAKDVFIQPEIFEANSKLNYLVTKLEQRINRFFISNTSQSYNLRSAGNIRAIADVFLDSLHSEFDKVDHPYFKSFFHYRLAEFELNTRHSNKVVYDKYFQAGEVSFSQLSFANSFKTFYNDYMTPKSVHRFSDSLESCISRNDYEGALRYLSTDQFLQRPELLELAFVSGLFELGREGVYPIYTIIALLDSAHSKSEFENIKTLATNSKDILLKLAPGTRAPNFVFADVVGNLYRISEYEGYYIYIQFFDEFNSESLRQMSLMKVLREGYGADIAMFSFSTSESLKRLREIPGKHDFDWFFGKVGSPDQVMEDYELRALPEYFFLDEELKIIKSPTPPPGAKIEKQFANIWNQKHPNKSVPFKLQPPPIHEDDVPPPPHE